MTVKELIEKLKEFPEDSVVYRDDIEYQAMLIEDVEVFVLPSQLSYNTMYPYAKNNIILIGED